jgi:hyperosmotically inducible protein
MHATKVAALVLAASFCAAQSGGCVSSSGERARGSGEASSGKSSLLDDAALTARVTTALSAAGIANPLKINVSTENGVVQLSGFLDSQDKARRAGEIARQVEGVKQVYNDIRVVPRG